LCIYSNFNFIRQTDAYAEDANVQNNHDNGTAHQHESHLNKVNGSGGKDGDDDNKIRVYNFSSSDDNCVTYVLYECTFTF